MKIKELMNPQVRSIRAHESLDAATRIMWNEDVGALPVVDEWNHPIGMVTDRDIAMSAAINGKPLAAMTVSECMSRQLFQCGEADSLETATALMRTHQVRRVPIVDGDECLVGVLTLGDLARAAGHAKAARARRALSDELVRTLAAICEPRNGRAEAEGVVELQPAEAPAARARKGAAGAARKPARKTAARKKTARRKTAR